MTVPSRRALRGPRPARAAWRESDVFRHWKESGAISFDLPPSPLRGAHDRKPHLSHPAGVWWVMPRPLVRREIKPGYEAIVSSTGRAPRFFRSPVGMNNASVHPIARELGLRVAGWSVDGCDGCPATPTSVVTRITRAIHPGAIVLVREGEGLRHRLVTLWRLLDNLNEAGYRFSLPPEQSLR